MDQKKIELKDDELYDQSRRAQRVLDSVLHGEFDANGNPIETNAIDVIEARHAKPVAPDVSLRASTRTLFTTSDQSVLVDGSTVQREYAALATAFDEVHVIVLVPRNGSGVVKKVAERVWVYPVFAGHWWLLPFRARQAARAALVFNTNIRPDVIVAAEPYEAGLAAYLIARAFNRPWQVHVPEDFTADSFADERPHGVWLVRLARFVLKRAPSVRVHTDRIKSIIEPRFVRTADVEVLPRFRNVTGYITATPSFDIHDRYKSYVFIALVFAPLIADGPLQDVFTALNRVLHNPRIGLLIVGDGPARELYAEKAKILGIERNVMFVKTAEDAISLFKTADLLIEPATTDESETTVMRAAAAGLPILAAKTDFRTDLFEDGVSAFLYSAGEHEQLSRKFMKFINQPALRKQFTRTGQQVAKERLIEDPTAYYRAFRDSVEVVLGVEEKKSKDATK